MWEKTLNFHKISTFWDALSDIVLSADRPFLTQERVAPHSRVEIRSARDTNDIFCQLYTKIQSSRCRFACGKLIFRTLEIFRNSAGKSTFRTQKETDMAEFRCRANKKWFLWRCLSVIAVVVCKHDNIGRNYRIELRFCTVLEDPRGMDEFLK